MVVRVILSVVACLFALSPLHAGEAKKTNIVLFLADDLGYGDLGCYGHPVIKTPNLDRLAQQGTRFTDCHSAGAVCSPSRSSLMTGRTPYRNGVFTWIPAGSEIHLRTSEVSLAALLRQVGYATCHVGKWHLNGLFNNAKQPQPSDHGFDWWLATQNNAGPSHKFPANFVRNGKDVPKTDDFSAQVIAQEAIDWLKKERDPNKPFFLNVWFHEPHLPIEANPKFQELYPDLVKKDPDKAQHHADVTQLDHAVGMLLKYLDDNKLADDTIVIFTSDNGPEGKVDTVGRTRGSTGGFRGRKRSVYEGGIRVAGIVRWPGHVPAGKTNPEPIVGSDFFPTLVKIGGAKLPTDRVLDGVDLHPVFEGKSVERPIPFYWRCSIAPEKMKICMRQGDWTLLATPGLTDFELYDLKTDPKQSTDLSAKEAQRFEQMKATLTKLNREIEAEPPGWWKKEAPKKK